MKTPELLLTKWTVFTELYTTDGRKKVNTKILTDKTNIDSPQMVSDNPLIALASAHLAITKVDLMLEYYKRQIIYYMEKFYNEFKLSQTYEDIKLRADDIANSFSDYPNNKCDDATESAEDYQSHLVVFMNMNSVKTGFLFGLESYYILALMLINEALRLKDDESLIAAKDDEFIIAAVEAVDALDFAKSGLTIHEFEEKQQNERIIKDHQAKSAAHASKARHKESNIVKLHAQFLARKLKKEKPKFTPPQIRDKIADEVIQYAKDNKFKYSAGNIRKTIYTWVLKAIKTE